MWVTFARNFDFSPKALKARFTTAYKAGMKANVTRECAALAESVGALEPPEPVQEEGDVDRRG